MNQVLALAIAVFYAGTVPALSLGEKAAPGITSRTTTAQAPTIPEGAQTPSTAAPAEQQQPGAEDPQQKKSFWNSTWWWVTFALVGTIVVTVPWLVVVVLMFRAHRTAWLKR